MARLIDADALERHEADTYGAVEDVVYAEDIDNAPTIDAVSVVRCKDCRWCSQSGLCNLYISFTPSMKPDDFCSYGERSSHHDSLCDQTEEVEA